MNVRFFEMLHESDVAVGATTEARPIFSFAVGAKHGFQFAPKRLWTTSAAGAMPTLRKLDGERDGVAAAEAESRDSALQITTLQFVEQRYQDARA